MITKSTKVSANKNKTIAFFDFDGTITTKDSLIDFIRFSVGKQKFVSGFLILLPTLVMYKLGIIANYVAKERVTSFFFGKWTIEEFTKIAECYSIERIPKILRKEAVRQLTWHKNQGHTIVIVSASFEEYLKKWCIAQNVSFIATRLEKKDGMLTGNFASKNCYGIEKVNRIKESYSLNDFNVIYAYGDSRGDREMIELADIKYYRWKQK